MGDNRRKQLVEQYEDIALALLMDEYAEEEGARLLREFEEAQENGDLPEIPKELDEKCRQMIDWTFAKQTRNSRLRQVSRFIAKAAVFTLAFLGLSAAMVLSVEAFRTPVLNFLMDKAEKYTTVNFENDIKSNPEHAKDVLTKLEEILPDGYQEVVKVGNPDGTFTIFYQDGENRIISLENTHSMGLANIDTENSTVKTVLLENGCEVLFIAKDGYRVVWTSIDDLVYDFYTDGLDLEVFWEIVNYLAN